MEGWGGGREEGRGRWERMKEEGRGEGLQKRESRERREEEIGKEKRKERGGECTTLTIKSSNRIMPNDQTSTYD